MKNYFCVNKKTGENVVTFDLDAGIGKVAFVCMVVGFVQITRALTKPVKKILNRKKEND